MSRAVKDVLKEIVHTIFIKFPVAFTIGMFVGYYGIIVAPICAMSDEKWDVTPILNSWLK